MFSSLCRASKPVWYVAAVERKIATKTRGVHARLLRGRALSATRAGIYLNLKLGNRSQATPGFPRFRRLFSLTLSLFLLFLLLSCSLSLLSRLFASFLLCCQTTLPRGFLAPLIPASCRSSLRPARPSKNSLTCLGGLFLLSPFSSFPPLVPRVHERCEEAQHGKPAATTRRSAECLERKVSKIELRN